MKRDDRITILDARRDAYEQAAAQLNADVLAGRITVDVWFERTAEELKGLHITAYMAGRDLTWNEMTFADWGRIGAVLRKEYGHLNTKRSILTVNPDRWTLAQLDASSKQYAASAMRSFSRGEAAHRGLDPSVLPAHPADGSTPCRGFDKCRWAITTISKVRGDYVVSWRLGRAEHCRVCVARSRHKSRGGWGGLRIRGGVLIDTPTPING